MTAKLTKKQLEVHNKLKQDYPYYAKNLLRVKDKDGSIVPFNFFQSQKYIHRQLEQQKAQTGKVRAYILKGRQTRGSTYVAGRFFHRCAYKYGTDVFILTHRDDATVNLFSMVKRFKNHLPEPFQPSLVSDTGNSLVFKNESRYSLGTAASPDVGRSMTVQCFHGSEVAFYRYADEIQTGVLQTIGNVPGTEIIFESTANGPRGMFYQGIKDVLSGKNKEFKLVFVPWYWEPTYFDTPPDGFSDADLDEEEQQLKKIYNLSFGQLLWRRKKVVELGRAWKFKQEYPNYPLEAFQSSDDSLIDPDKIMEARKSSITDPTKPVIMGVDPARSGDRTVIVLRQGSQWLSYHTFDKMEQMKLAGICANFIEKYNVYRMFIDAGEGSGTFDRLIELGYKKRVIRVHFNEGALDPDRFLNKRAEMLYLVKEWIEEGGVSIPDSEEIHSDLLSVPHEEITSTQRIYIIPKKKIKEMYGQSPDIFDAFALTFAYPISKNIDTETPIKKVNIRNSKAHSPLTTLQRHRKIRSIKKKCPPVFSSGD